MLEVGQLANLSVASVTNDKGLETLTPGNPPVGSTRKVVLESTSQPADSNPSSTNHVQVKLFRVR